MLPLHRTNASLPHGRHVPGVPEGAQTRSEVDASGASSAADKASRHDPGRSDYATTVVGYRVTPPQ